MKKRKTAITLLLIGTFLTAAVFGGCGKEGKQENGKVKITNVSYDPTRELYAEYNEAFKDYYKEKTGNDIEIVQSHGGSVLV